MQAGKPAVWTMLNFHYGDPILKAMDMEAVCPGNYGAIAAAMGVARQYLDRADAMANNPRFCSVPSPASKKTLVTVSSTGMFFTLVLELTAS